MIKIIESPREGMQGFSRIIPIEEKVRYIDLLLRSGFDTVETGSFVSPRLVPQMADSLEVLEKLDLSGVTTNRMFLVLNEKGAKLIAAEKKITHISYPFSFSPAFLKLNVNSTVEQSLETVRVVTALCAENNKQAVIYISMAFGNPYNEPWNVGMLVEWVGKLREAGARIIPLSNVSMEIDAAQISEVYSTLIPMFPDVTFGLHLHTANLHWYKKVEAAWQAGCRRFDGVINGHGGCPMAGREMLGNLMTENLVEFARLNNIPVSINNDVFSGACRVAAEVFREDEFQR
jgi:hydroxymethylglutaryl-CoA lyase